MRSAGIVQRAVTKSISFHVASMNSDLRTPVSRTNFAAKRSVVSVVSAAFYNNVEGAPIFSALGGLGGYGIHTFLKTIIYQ